ncbi:MAG: hybrid sensor histidine kinase/response regulator [Acidobacteria bacterium]|nr:MAG: hybrid sensor histidine kinase/response regulator [Acidobacteriota bacterium]
MARILIVDDKEENLSLLEDLLTGHGHAVVSARNGVDALSEARRNPPDLVIADILMPVMDGFTLCREWRQDLLLKSKPFVFLTATYSDPKDEEFALGLGADRFVLKPVEPEVLSGQISELLEQYQKGSRTAEAKTGLPPLVFLRQYNEALIRKLEDKLEETEKANRKLGLYREHLEELVEARTVELKKANEELLKLQNVQENLTHLIVHDMSSPLTVVIGGLDLAIAEPDLPDSVRHNLEAARESARRLGQMIAALLDVSRMEAGEMRVSLVEQDLLDLVRTAVDMFSILATRKNIRIGITGNTAACLCDAELIKRVIFNLLDNAIKFSSDSGTVALQVSKDATRAMVSVSDSGPGVPEACRDRIFEKFVQVEARDLGCLRSSGLGLAFCKMAVEAHHGRIGVENQSGETRFWFTLPVQNP